MSGHGCSVDTALPEGFLRERLLETRGELYHHRQASDQRTASSPQIIPGTFMHQIPSMSPPTFGSLIDLYRGDPVDGLFSSLRISSSTTTVNTTCSASNHYNFSKTASAISCDAKQNTWSTPATATTDREESKKRSSSLKSSRTNGNTNGAGEKKIVRFADVLGLDLADVHTFLDEIPRIPKSAFKDLKNVDLTTSSTPFSSTRNDYRNLVPLFSQPAAQGFVNDKIRKWEKMAKSCQSFDSNKSKEQHKI